MARRGGKRLVTTGHLEKKKDQQTRLRRGKKEDIAYWLNDASSEGDNDRKRGRKAGMIPTREKKNNDFVELVSGKENSLHSTRREGDDSVPTSFAKRVPW